MKQQTKQIIFNALETELANTKPEREDYRKKIKDTMDEVQSHDFGKTKVIAPSGECRRCGSTDIRKVCK